MPATSFGIFVGEVFLLTFRVFVVCDYAGMLKHDVLHVASWGTGLLTLSGFSLAAAITVLTAFHRITLGNEWKPK